MKTFEHERMCFPFPVHVWHGLQDIAKGGANYQWTCFKFFGGPNNLPIVLDKDEAGQVCFWGY